MRIVLTAEEIEQFRAELADCRAALAALDAIADCEGDLEDAAIGVAIQSGQEPDTNDRWLEGLAKRWRHIICEAALREELEDGLNTQVLTTLASQTTLPLKLATPVAIYVIKTGLPSFCAALEAKIQ